MAEQALDLEISPPTGPSLKLALSLTERCNLSCDYCYFKNQSNTGIMTEETAQDTADFFADQAREMAASNLIVTFFGGEPLLARHLINPTATYLKQVSPVPVRFAINTNCTLLTESDLALFREHEFTVYASIDGTSETHDLHRKTTRGKGSFSSIEPWLKELLSLRTVVIKVVTPLTAVALRQDVDFLLNLGFDRIQIAPDFAARWQPAELDVLVDQYKLLQTSLQQCWNSGRHTRVEGLCSKLDAVFAPKTEVTPRCLAGQNAFGISSRGTIFPCVRFISSSGAAKDILGDVRSGWSMSRRTTETPALHRSSRECEICTERSHCRGYHCACLNYQTTGRSDRVAPIVCEHERRVSKQARDMAEQCATRFFSGGTTQ